MILSAMFLFPSQLFGKQNDKPDFAFPEKVEKTALSDLKTALKADNGKGVVNALIRLGLAKSVVNTDSIAPFLAEVRFLTDEEKDPATKALLNSLQAKIYSQLYNNDAWHYNQRETVADAGENYTLWSRRQFLDRISALCEASLADGDALKSLPISDFSGIVDYSRADMKFYPTLFDFISQNAIDCLDGFTSRGTELNVLNVSLLRNPENVTLYPGETCAPLAQILKIYDGLIGFHRNDPPALFMQEIAVRQFVAQHLFDSAQSPMPRFGFGRGNANRQSQSPLNQELLRLYQNNSKNEFSGMFLEDYAESFGAGSDAAEVYAMLLDFRSHFPGYYNIAAIDNLIGNLSRPSAEVSLPEQVVPGKPVKVTVKSVNGRKVKVDFYDVSAYTSLDFSSSSLGIKNLPAVFVSETVEFDDAVPFNSSKDFTITFPKYGAYVYRLTVDGQSDKGSYPLVRCSEIGSALTNSADKTQAWAVNPVTGAPIEGVSYFFKPWSGRSGYTALSGVTDKDGKLTVTTKDSGRLSGRKGKDIYSATVGLSRYYDSSNDGGLSVDFQTSLQLYRPGDEVQFSLVAFHNNLISRSLAADTKIRVSLRDANYQAVDTLIVTTDLWGRAEGSFTLPSTGLTGYFTLIAGEIRADNRGPEIGHTSFEVSDYNLPTFAVSKTAVNRPASVAQGASVEGKAETYSGFPVSDAAVKASLAVRSGFWWWATTSPVFFTCETTTDAEGKFTVVIPSNAISSAPNPNGTFVCSVEVTSPAGETRTMEATFNMGKPYSLQVSVPQVIDRSADFKANVVAVDENGDEKDIALNYKLLQILDEPDGSNSDDEVSDYFAEPVNPETSVRSREVASGTLNSGSFADMIRNLNVGQYAIEFAPADTLLAEPSAYQQFTVYSPESAECPLPRPLWIPVKQLTADANGEAVVSFGSDTDDANVLMITSVYPGKVLEEKWLKTTKGVHPLKLKLSDVGQPMKVSFLCVKDFKRYAEDVQIQPASSKKAIDLRIVTFRDKVTPLQTEKVTLKVTPRDGASAQSAVILDMSNKAIDALASNPLTLSGVPTPYWRVNTSGWNFGSSSSSVYKDYKYNETVTIVAPTFEFYGLGFTSYGSPVYIRGRKMMKTASRTMNVMYDASAPVVEEAEMATSDEVAMAAPSVAGGVTADGGAEAKAEEKSDAESYRPSEIPLAFFRPMLTTAEDGTLEISYEVPDANTTWLLRALAYNNETLSATASAEIVASKPVMVSQNAPRFLRTSDCVQLAASIMNNTDSVQVVKVLSEIVSSGSGKVLETKEEELALAARTAAVAAIDVTAAPAETGLIYRVRATSGNFTDGEQSLIPVLPSQQDVVESQIFYLAPDEAHFTMDLPAMSGDDRAFLNFTENPAWQVVSALPGLRDIKINSSVEASAALFSACVAQGILNDNPEVARVLRRWAENPEDSALVSNLQKNQELKSMLLSATPWVSEALSDTQRMQRLALLFDKRQTQRVIAEAVDILAKTRADGGWCWTSQYPVVSQWCTELIMEELGDLNRMGWLPADKRLVNMIKESCEYLDSEAVKDYKDYPKGDYWLYVMLRDAFPQYKRSAAAQRVVEAQIQKCVANWKTSDAPTKAVYAQILNNHGYKATAKQILASLREYATSTPDRGMWWQELDRCYFRGLGKIGMTAIILDAFHAVEPGCADVEKIRQWLILNKTNNDWGNAVITSQVISSILTSGKSLKINTRGTAIHIGDQLLEPAKQEYATGAFTEQITPLLVEPETLTIDRQADYPSVGAVVTMRTLPMDQVKAVGCKEISVEKALTVFDDSQWNPVEEVKVGDRVMVTLTLKVESDLSYVVLEDLRAAGLEPAEQLPTPIFAEGLCFYRENRDSQTNIFIDRLPRGTYRLTYELFASQAGTFSSGAARVQSQYNPIVAAHSGGIVLTIK